MRRFALLPLLLMLPGCLALKVGGRTETTAPPPPPPADVLTMPGPKGPPDSMLAIYRQQMREEARASDVCGFAMGRTETEARKAAWTDAIARMKEMGFTDGKHTIKEVASGSTCKDMHGYFEAQVHLRVSGGPDPTP